MSPQATVRTMLRMRAREGCERPFEEAMRRAAHEISRVPGNLRQDLLRDRADGRTFVITSDWTDAGALDAFGRSSTREVLTAALRDLRESAERSTYEILEVVPGRGPRIRVIVTVTVDEGEERAYERAYLKVAARMRGTPGHVREELLREPGTRTYHLLAEWEDEASFNAWVDDPAHMETTAPLMPFLLGSFERRTYYISARPGDLEPVGEVSAPPADERPAAAAAPPRDGAHAHRDAVEVVNATPNVPVASAGASSNGHVPRASSIEVLVVGAGPTGLTAAIELARRGVACRIVDKRPRPAEQADKAIGIHCRTMEIWEDLGIVREAMDVGTWLHGQTVFVNGRQTHQVDWDLPDLPYAHLGLPQYETERLLTARLMRSGVGVERGVELVTFEGDGEGVDASLVHPTGDTEAVRARYLIGCDGAHSTVRQRLGLTFEGGLGMFPQLFMLGDADLDWSMPRGHMLRFIELDDDEMKGMLVCVPLAGKGRYRVATLAPPRLQAELGSGAVPPGFWEEYAPPTLADIQAVLDRLAPAGTTATNLRWSSVFRIKHGIVDRYRVGRVFVAGDAAHLHPPAGGQGMNTGIQDAWNLGWKLALDVQGQATPELLDSYEAERRPAGKEIVDRAVKIAFTDEMDMEDQKQQFLTEMQMTLSYAGSPLVGETIDGGGPHAGPRPGERAPDVPGLQRFGVGHPVRLFELTSGVAHTLLVYSDGALEAQEREALERLVAELRARRADLLAAYLILGSAPGADEADGLAALRDAAGTFRTAYGLTRSGAYLVRPDGHVGFRCQPLSVAALEEHLRHILAVDSLVVG